MERQFIVIVKTYIKNFKNYAEATRKLRSIICRRSESAV